MTEIKAERINLLFERMNLILGNGAGQNGYGQGQGAGYGPEIAAYPVSNNPSGNTSFIVSAADINALFADMLRCRIHQVGTAPTEIAEIVKDLNVVGLNSSFFIDDQGSVTTDTDGEQKGIVDYENLMTQIEADKFLAHLSQMSLETTPITNTARSTAWNGVIQHEFTVSFRNPDHRRHFFNTGGEIRISASLSYTGTEEKTKDWQILLNNVGTIRFAFNSTTSTAGGVSDASIGNYSLTNSYRRIYTKGRTAGIYNDNEYFVDARQVDESQIRFRVSFADNDIGSGPTLGAPLNPVPELNKVDEDVSGILESNVRILRASSTTSVRVPAPTFFNNIALV